jgi:hypothetical protein
VEQTVSFVVRGPITRADLPGLTERVCALLARTRNPVQPAPGQPAHAPPGPVQPGPVQPAPVQPPGVVHCDVAGVHPDAPTVEALARLHLAAQRYRCRVRLCNASAELMNLVAFMGLGEVLVQ